MPQINKMANETRKAVSAFLFRSGFQNLFVSWIAPRGIVAAAVASLFAETLKGTPEFAQQAGFVESLTFLIIGGSVFFQGATARFVGKLLKVIEPDPNGVVIIGANLPARHLAKALKTLGIDMILLDSNNSLVSKAKKEIFKIFGKI
jgi:NhaP-type Na+/H+ and K+/H+ antiporter